MHKIAGAILALPLLVAAAPRVANSDPPSPQTEALTGILERIRQDVGYYEVQAARLRNDINTPVQDDKLPLGIAPDSPSPVSVCDVKDFDFDVTNVVISLQTVVADTETASAGLQVPLLGREGSVDADVTRQKSRTATVVLTRHFTYDKEKLSQYQDSEDYQTLEAGHRRYRQLTGTTAVNPVLPIADTLIELHTNLTRSAAKLPCFEWTDGDANLQSSSITLEFLIQQAENADVGFNFWLVSGKADAKVEHDAVNTVIVSFAPHHALPVSVANPQQFGQAQKPHG